LILAHSQKDISSWERIDGEEVKLKVLVVDDDQHIVDLLLIILRNEGFRDVMCYTSPNAAFAALLSANIHFDCLILDINMPDMNGIEFCRRVREIPVYRGIPVIMLTALRDEQTMREALDVGATDYITKPFDVLQIGIRVRLTASLVRANQTISYLKLSQEAEPEIPLAKPHGLTRTEVMSLFSEDLYPSKKAR
jgi:DNA-binding response OmpR family regulator